MPNLNRVTITFTTHSDDKNNDTVLHIFVKNRRGDTSFNVGQCDYITDHLAYLDTQRPNFAGINPFLAVGEDIQQGVEFANNSGHTFDIPLRQPQPVPMEEIVLPVVNIHILPANNDTWKFSFTINFFFDDAPAFSWSSDSNGVTGIILDQDNRDYSGICTENPNVPAPPLHLPETDAVLTQVKMVFWTHGDNKNDDTALNVHIVNRLGPLSSQDIAIGNDLLHGQEFPESSADNPSLKTVIFGAGGLPLASNSIQMSAIVLPQVFIDIAAGNDKWIFDYRVYYTFSNGQTFISETTGVILDQDYHKHAGFYQGGSFPTVTPPGRPQLYSVAINHTGAGAKPISLAYLQKKLDDFINNRQLMGTQYPPIRKVRLHNTGTFGVLPESYYDVQAIDADPAAPGTLSPPGSNENFRWDSSPTSLGQQRVTFGDFYFNDIKSQSLTAKVDGSSVTPITVELDFDCSGTNQIVGWSDSFSGMTLKSFTVVIRLTLSYDKSNNRVDVMSWVSDIDNWITTTDPLGGLHLTGQFLGTPISQDFNSQSDLDEYKSATIGGVIGVRVVSTSATDPGGAFQKAAREKIFSTLSSAVSAFDPTTLRDHINSTVNSWLLGGVLASDIDALGNHYDNGCKVNFVKVNADSLTIDYNGPQQTFSPPAPAGWPPANFTPGTLANIDHIVVLTMENRSFDHILGYLSLPPSAGGLGRTGVDGLKGGEFNMANGVMCPSFPLPATDTILTPDPPHGYEPVIHAINGSKMDGFAQAYCDGSGLAVAPRIMGFHTGVNVPAYDALARDFAICHRWFASHPGPTFCNRFHETTGRLNLDAEGFWEFDNSHPLRPVFTPTIFDYLTQQGVSWRYFESYYCFLRFFEGHTFDTTNIVSFDDPEFGFLNLAKTGDLPSVSFIDPHFIELPPDGNCDGPPADIQKGQDLVRQVVNAVVSGANWAKTLLIITYDEHGGIFDHVPPPAAVKNSPESLAIYGVRVPTFVISPWVKPGSVFGHDGIAVGGGGGTTTAAAPSTKPADAVTGMPTVTSLLPLHFDHTSILKTIARRFMNTNPPYLSARYAAANDLSSVIENTPQTSRFLPFIPYNFVYSHSQKRLDVQGAGTSPGTLLWQYDPNTGIAQQFSFEDAGGGLFYIRTFTGNLYLTASAGGVTQEVKYPGGAAGQNPDAQHWSLTTNSNVATEQDILTVRNAAFPGMVLQPAGNSPNSGVTVVLAAPEATHGVGATPNAWQVTSPLLGDGQVVGHL